MQVVERSRRFTVTRKNDCDGIPPCKLKAALVFHAWHDLATCGCVCAFAKLLQALGILLAAFGGTNCTRKAGVAKAMVQAVEERCLQGEVPGLSLALQ